MSHTYITHLLPYPVYYITSDKDQYVLLGLDVKINQNTISWFDTSRQRSKEIESILSHQPNHFIFTAKNLSEIATYTLQPLTLDLFEQNVRPFMTNIPQNLTQESMIEALQKSRNDCY